MKTEAIHKCIAAHGLNAPAVAADAIDQLTALEAQCEAQAQEIKRLDDALRRYGGHDDGCEFLDGDCEKACDCGFDIALARPQEPNTKL